MPVPQRCSALAMPNIDPLSLGPSLLGILSEELLVVITRQPELVIIRWAKNAVLEIATPPALHYFAEITG